MTTDLTPAARLTGSIVANVPDDALDAPTPCAEMTVRALLAHLDGLAEAFRAAARRDFGPLTDTSDGALPLADGWRQRIPAALAALAEAWADPEAWRGETRAGGVELPGEVAGLVALNEVVMHGWDVAAATGQDYRPDDVTAGAVLDFLTGARREPMPADLYGPEVHVTSAASPFERALGLAGRDPGWGTVA